MENKKIITNLENKNGGKLNQYKSPYKNDKEISKIKNSNFLEIKNNNYIREISEEKENKFFTDFLKTYNKSDEYEFNENEYRFPVSNKEITDNNIYDNNSTSKVSNIK